MASSWFRWVCIAGAAVCVVAVLVVAGVFVFRAGHPPAPVVVQHDVRLPEAPEGARLPDLPTLPPVPSSH